MKKKIPIPENEAERLNALLQYEILDTLPDKEFDELTHLASFICDSPISLISLLDANRQWFKSKVGLNVSETPRDISICQFAIMDNVIFEVEDSLKDERFKNNPLVTQDPKIRFYAGVPLKNPKGYNLGTLCVIDTKPKKLSSKQKEALKILAHQVVNQLELRKKNSILKAELDKTTKEQLKSLGENLNIYKKALDETALITIADEAGIIQYVNQKFCDVSKYSETELIGQDHRIINSGYHSKDFMSNLWSTISDGKIWKGELKNKKRDGSIFWVETTIVPFVHNDGKVYKFIAIHQDITRKKERDMEAATFYAWQNAILNGTQYSVISTDKDGTIRSFNKGAEEMLGYRMDEVIGKTTPVIIHDVNEVVERAKYLSKELNINIEPGFDVFVLKANSGKPDINRWTYIHKNGTRIPVILSVTALTGTNNEIIGYLGVAQDITAQLKNEESIRLYEDIVKNMNSKLFVWELTNVEDLEFRMISCNPIAARFLELDVEANIGKTMKEILPSLAVSGIPEIFKKVVLSGKMISLIDIPYSDDRVQNNYFNLTAFPLPGKKVGVTYENITERKETELELIAAKEKAIQAVVAKNNFLANMSHEIRTPMNAIIGFTDLLNQTTLEEKQSEFVNAIKLAGANLLTIINDILDFSKIESGKIILENVPFHLRKTLNGIYNLLLEQSKEKGILLHLFLEDTLPEFVMGDSVRLTQILVNLIGNAIKFTEKGEVIVSIKKIEEDPLFHKIHFSIRDTGIGIAEDKQEQIFDRFAQANSETTRKYGGTGLGLSIVKSLVELLGGKIILKSRLGEGSEFSFELLFKKIDKKNIKPFEESLIFAKPIANVKILLCEDNVLNQRLAQNVIDKFEFELKIAENGIIAIEKLRNESFDIILMDLQMPEMDGYQTTRYIRNELKLTIPIIAMTAHSMVGEKEKCIRNGMNDYIGKPFNQYDLYNKICSNLSHNNPVNENNLVQKEKDQPNSNSINLSYLKNLSGGNRTFEKELIELFIFQVPIDIAEMEEALKTDNFHLFKGLAHKLKSTIAVVGLSAIKNEIVYLEHSSDNEDVTDVIYEKFNFIKSTLSDSILVLKETLRDQY